MVGEAVSSTVWDHNWQTSLIAMIKIWLKLFTASIIISELNSISFRWSHAHRTNPWHPFQALAPSSSNNIKKTKGYKRQPYNLHLSVVFAVCAWVKHLNLAMIIWSTWRNHGETYGPRMKDVAPCRLNESDSQQHPRYETTHACTGNVIFRACYR